MLFSGVFTSFRPGTRVATVALFTAAAVVANTFTLDVTASQKITVTYLVCFFAGAVMGALPGFAAGFLGDALAFLIHPSGMYFFPFSVTSGLLALIPGVVMNRKFGRPFARMILSLVLSYVTVTVLINSGVNYLYMRMYIWHGAKKAFLVYFAGRIAFQSVVFLVNAILVALLFPAAEKMLAKMFGSQTFFRAGGAPHRGANADMGAENADTGVENTEFRAESAEGVAEKSAADASGAAGSAAKTGAEGGEVDEAEDEVQSDREEKGDRGREGAGK